MARTIEPLLGTRAEVAVTASSREATTVAELAILDEVRRLESVFSVFEPASAIAKLRATGATDVAELRTVVALAEHWQTRTAGAFHPNTQALTDLWDTAAATGSLPSVDELEATANHVQTSRSARWINLNAIAKGWIANHAVSSGMASSGEVTSAWLSLGGDAVHRGTGSIRVGIEDPHRPYDNVAPMATTVLDNEALATSGGSRRWWQIDGKRYPKVLDPRNGQPVDRLASATIVAPDAATADVLATVALVVDIDALIDLATDAGAAWFLVTNDREVVHTPDRFTPS